MKTYILLSVVLIGFSCHKEVEPKQVMLDATVLSVYASDCSLPLLDFGLGADQIGQLTTTGKGAKICFAAHLDKQFKVGDQLSVVVRIPQQSDYGFVACTAMLQSYLTVTVISSVKK